jgi:hypothetical protein
VLAKYRTHWPRIGAVIAMLIGGATAMSARRLTKPQILSAANLMALMAHQYEEYVHPGYFPGQSNSPHAFTAKQMGPYDIDATESA